MTRFYYLSIVLLFFSCGQLKVKKVPENKIADKLYFDFDKIVHYFLDIDQDSVLAIHQNRDKSTRNQLLDNILVQYGKESVNDTAFLNSLDALPFKKVVIDPALFSKFRDLFKEKKHEFPVYAACSATWRDILIFKKSENTIGIAKLCFDCDRYYIVGASANTDEFGQSGDFKKLYKLLRKR
jgi:hypothetical protein